MNNYFADLWIATVFNRLSFVEKATFRSYASAVDWVCRRKSDKDRHNLFSPGDSIHLPDVPQDLIVTKNVGEDIYCHATIVCLKAPKQSLKIKTNTFSLIIYYGYNYCEHVGDYANSGLAMQKAQEVIRKYKPNVYYRLRVEIVTKFWKFENLERTHTEVIFNSEN